MRCSSVTPLTEIEQFTSRPTLMMLMLAEAVCGLWQLDFLAPRQQDVELRLQHSAVVDVGDVDGPAVAADVVDHGLGGTGLRSCRLSAAPSARSEGATPESKACGMSSSELGSGSWAQTATAAARRPSPGGSCCVDDDQRDHQADDGQHCRRGQHPQPAGRLRLIRRRRFARPCRRILPTVLAVLAGRVGVVAVGRVRGQLLSRGRRGGGLIGGAVWGLARIRRIGVSRVAVTQRLRRVRPVAEARLLITSAMW